MKQKIKTYKPSIRARLTTLEKLAHAPIMEAIRIETIEKQIQEIYDKINIIEKELIKPLRQLQSESNSD